MRHIVYTHTQMQTHSNTHTQTHTNTYKHFKELNNTPHHVPIFATVDYFKSVIN